MFSGDTGYFDDMKTIGDKYGPFDLVMIEVGAYHKTWPDWHIGPEQAIEAHRIMRGKLFLPIHWGLFNLALHGSAMSDIQLMRNGHHHGQKLAQDFGLTCITVRYNSGLHISENGEKLAAKLQELAEHIPDVPIIILGFSMGGLVARSAVNQAEMQSLSWRNRLRGMIFLGTPHHGAPLERMGNIFQKLLESTGYSAPIARLARLRSAGVTDLRFGSILREHWSGADRFDHVPDARTPVPLPTNVLCFAVAGTLSKSLDEGPESLSGDGLVPVSSALGEHENSALNLGLQEHEKKVILNCGHLDLLDHPLVSQELHAFLTTTSKDNLT